MWIFETIKEYQEQIRTFVLQFLGRNVFLEDIDLLRGTRTIPFGEYVNVVEHNLKNLVGTDVTEDMQSTVVWHGEHLDSRRLDHNDVNRWFDTIRLLYNFTVALQQRYKTTGNLHSGGYPELQILGIG